ncbi:OmpH family outer membrane protein [bacterium]|nr:OmpH family outer membrane protein [bacterium]
MKIKFLIVTSLIMLLSLSVIAQETLKVGYVNLNKALNESSEGRRSKRVLQAQKEQVEKSLALKKLEIESKSKELQEGLMLSEATKAQKRNEVEELKKAFVTEAKQEEALLRKDEARYTQKIFEDLVSIVQKIAAAENYDVILEVTLRQGLLYSKYTVTDITDKVILEYDKLQNVKSSE